MLIDQAARLKPGFTAGRPVVLGDGQTWTFGLPRLRLAPRRDGAGFRTAVGRAGLPDYERWYNVLTGVERPPVDEYWAVRMTAAATMLTLNYELSDAELDELLAFEDDGPDGPYHTRWGEIDAAVMGLIPKP
jgi:hypothetical protein